MTGVQTCALPICMEEHPVRRLFDAGVPIILNTDDPALFDCSLDGEYGLAARVFGFSQAELAQIAANSFRYAFSDAARAVTSK